MIRREIDLKAWSDYRAVMASPRRLCITMRAAQVEIGRIHALTSPLRHSLQRA